MSTATDNGTMSVAWLSITLGGAGFAQTLAWAIATDIGRSCTPGRRQLDERVGLRRRRHRAHARTAGRRALRMVERHHPECSHGPRRDRRLPPYEHEQAPRGTGQECRHIVAVIVRGAHNMTTAALEMAERGFDRIVDLSWSRRNPAVFVPRPSSLSEPLSTG
jgi:hypothetical protein